MILPPLDITFEIAGAIDHPLCNGEDAQTSGHGYLALLPGTSNSDMLNAATVIATKRPKTLTFATGYTWFECMRMEGGMMVGLTVDQAVAAHKTGRFPIDRPAPWNNLPPGVLVSELSRLKIVAAEFVRLGYTPNRIYVNQENRYSVSSENPHARAAIETLLIDDEIRAKVGGPVATDTGEQAVQHLLKEGASPEYHKRRPFWDAFTTTIEAKEYRRFFDAGGLRSPLFISGIQSASRPTYDNNRIVLPNPKLPARFPSNYGAYRDGDPFLCALIAQNNQQAHGTKAVQHLRAIDPDEYLYQVLRWTKTPNMLWGDPEHIARVPGIDTLVRKCNAERAG